MSDQTNSMKTTLMGTSSGQIKVPQHSTNTPIESSPKKHGIGNSTFWYSSGFIALFVLLALFDERLLSSWVNAGFAWSVKVFGPYWQILLLLTFLIGLGLAAGRTGKVILGGKAKPPVHDTSCSQCEQACLLYTSPSPRDRSLSRMPSSA